MSEQELYGTWSSQTQGPVPGRLLVDTDGKATLQLEGHLRSSGRIAGQLGTGEPVTLLGTHETRRASHGHYVHEFLISTAAIGVEIADEADCCFSWATLKLLGLEETIGTSGLSLETSDLRARNPRFARVEWRPTPDIEITLPDATLRLKDHARFDHESFFRFALEHGAQARLAGQRLLSLLDVHHTFNSLMTFVAFATEAQVKTRELRVGTAPVDSGGAGARVLTRERARYGPMPGDVEPWLTLNELENPAGALSGFYRFAEEQHAAYLILHEYLVFASALNPVDKLLYLARFLEVYHRTRFPGPRDPDDVHAERVALVKKATVGAHKSWGSHILYRSNEIFFKDRVRDLMNGAAVAAAPVMGASAQTFAKVVGDSRNYWTHYSDELKDKALHDIELDDLDDRLLLVVRACVLDDIGVPAAEAEDCLKRDWRFDRRAGEPLRSP